MSKWIRTIDIISPCVSIVLVGVQLLRTPARAPLDSPPKVDQRALLLLPFVVKFSPRCSTTRNSLSANGKPHTGNQSLCVTVRIWWYRHRQPSWWLLPWFFKTVPPCILSTGNSCWPFHFKGVIFNYTVRPQIKPQTNLNLLELQ